MASTASFGSTMATTSAIGAVIGGAATSWLGPGAAGGAAAGSFYGAIVGAVITVVDLLDEITLPFGDDDEFQDVRDTCGTVRRRKGWSDGKVGVERIEGAGWIWLMRRLREDGASRSEAISAAARWLGREERFERAAELLIGKVEDARRQERKFMEDAKRPQSWSVQRYMDFLNAAK